MIKYSKVHQMYSKFQRYFEKLEHNISVNYKEGLHF